VIFEMVSPHPITVSWLFTGGVAESQFRLPKCTPLLANVGSSYR